MNTENIDVILGTELTDIQLTEARKFLNRFSFSTSALYALSLAMREMYTEGGQDEAPCADLLKQFACGAMVQAEAEEI